MKCIEKLTTGKASKNSASPGFPRSEALISTDRNRAVYTLSEFPADEAGASGWRSGTGPPEGRRAKEAIAASCRHAAPHTRNVNVGVFAAHGHCKHTDAVQALINNRWLNSPRAGTPGGSYSPIVFGLGQARPGFFARPRRTDRENREDEDDEGGQAREREAEGKDVQPGKVCQAVGGDRQTRPERRSQRPLLIVPGIVFDVACSCASITCWR